MQDGALMGARFHAAFDGETDRTTNGLGAPLLSGNDPDTPGNELRTHLPSAAKASRVVPSNASGR